MAWRRAARNAQPDDLHSQGPLDQTGTPPNTIRRRSDEPAPGAAKHHPRKGPPSMATDRTADSPHSGAALPPSRPSATPACDNESIGVIITDPQGRILMITRATPPAGRAPVAGHLDDHGTVEDAVRDEVSEEVGLTVTSLAVTIPRHWRDNICRRQDGRLGVGHFWTIFQAKVTGDIRTDPTEAVDARWYNPGELQDLADRTITYARGALSSKEFTTEPGIQPVWVTFFKQLGLIRINHADLVAVQNAARHPPGSADIGGAYEEPPEYNASSPTA
nr:NUDIX hydrolase [Micromonospora sp. DSM 115978]